MPLPLLTCEIPDETCCTLIFDTANFILNRVYDGIIDCMPPSECASGTLLRYVTMGNGDDGIPDSLTVAFTGSGISPKSTLPGGVTGPLPLCRGTFDIRLREAGWPIVGVANGAITPPDPVKQHAIARHAYAHGEQLYRTVRDFAHSRELTVSGVVKLNNVVLGDLRTLSPLGGIVGFAIPITVDLPFGQAGT